MFHEILPSHVFSSVIAPFVLPKHQATNSNTRCNSVFITPRCRAPAANWQILASSMAAQSACCSSLLRTGGRARAAGAVEVEDERAGGHLHAKETLPEKALASHDLRQGQSLPPTPPLLPLMMEAAAEPATASPRPLSLCFTSRTWTSCTSARGRGGRPSVTSRSSSPSAKPQGEIQRRV
jgi:hypothetical protein